MVNEKLVKTASSLALTFIIFCTTGGLTNAWGSTLGGVMSFCSDAATDPSPDNPCNAPEAGCYCYMTNKSAKCVGGSIVGTASVMMHTPAGDFGMGGATANIPFPCSDVASISDIISPSRPFCEKGSTIHIEDKSVGESIPVTGVPFSLTYFSNRVNGRTSDFSLTVPITNTTVPNVASQTITITDEAGNTLDTRTDSSGTLSPNQSYNYSFPGSGSVGMDIVNIAYNASVNPSAEDLARWYAELGDEVPLTWVDFGVYPVRIGNYRSKIWGLGTWTFSIHHFYDRRGKRLFLGDGTVRDVKARTIHFTDETPSYIAVGSENDAAEIFIFDSNGRHVKTLYGKTGSTLYSFSYDVDSRLMSITDAYENVTTMNRNASGDLTGIQSPYGQTTTVSLDANGYLASVTNPNSETYVMSYTPGGLLRTFKKPSGQISSMTYTNGGLLISNSNSAGSSTTLSDISKGTITPLPGDANILSSTSALGRVTTYGFQDDTTTKTQLHGSVYPDGSMGYGTYSPEIGSTNKFSVGTTERSVSDSKSFDPWLENIALFTSIKRITDAGSSWASFRTRTVTAGSASANVDSTPAVFQYTTDQVQSTVNGNLWDQTYDSSTQITTITSPENRVSRVSMDLFGKPTSIQWASFTPTNISYDSRGRLSQIKQNTRENTFTYNSSGFLNSVTNAAAQTTSFDYDNVGRVLTQTLPDTRAIYFSYDANGNLASITPPGKSAHTFTMNLFDLIASYLPPFLGGTTSTPTTYTYNNDRQLTSITRPSGATINFTYGPSSANLTEITTPTGTNTYTSQGGYIRQTISPDQYQVDRTYTGYSTKSEVLSDASSSTTIGRIDWEYNNDFNRTTSNLTPGAGPISSVSSLYDSDTLMIKAGEETMTRNPTSGLLTGTTLAKISDSLTYDPTYGELSAYSAQYNAGGKRTVLLLSETYTRDALGRILTKVDKAKGKAKTYAYTYDTTGRLTAVRLNNKPYSSYTYDSNSNRISGNVAGVSFTGTYDSQDRLSSYNTESYTYNLNGELTSRTDSKTGLTTTYAYDAFGNLKQAAVPTKTVNYKVDGFNRRIAKLTGTTVNEYYIYENELQIGAVLDSTFQTTHRFIYGSKSNVPDYMVKAGVTYRIISDPRGSVRLVVNAETGKILQEMDYDEFGKVISDTSPGFQPFGFAGGLYDQDTKLTHFGAREYDASIGRFIQKEPIPFYGADPNLYGYAFNDPINFVDLDGLAAQSAGEGTAYAPPGSYGGTVTGTISPIDAIGAGRVVATAVASAARVLSSIQIQGQGGGGRIFGSTIQLGGQRVPFFRLDNGPLSRGQPNQWHYHLGNQKYPFSGDPYFLPNSCGQQ